MTDEELVAKRLAFIETCLEELRREARLDTLDKDLRERRFVEHTLQLAIQGALDVASHIVSDQRLGEPRTQRELFELLARAGWLPVEDITPFRKMAGFRNALVHGYLEVDVAVIRDVMDNHLPDLEHFVTAIRQRLSGNPHPPG